MSTERTLSLFGKHLKRIRISQGMSQEKLGSLSNLDRTYISGIERGKRNVSLINIMKLASSLDVAPEELLSFEQEESL